MSTTILGPDDATGGDTEPVAEFDLDNPVAIHPLSYLPEGDEVTVGRRDTDSYCVLPADGAALLKDLERGVPPREAADRYAEKYGSPVDVAEFLAAMDELGFVAGPGEPTAEVRPVRGQRLGRALFSPVAWVGYAAILLTAGLVMLREPALAPHATHLFFIKYIMVINLTVFFGQIPLMLLHESFHVLAGRRLGLRTGLQISRRLFFFVIQTKMDGLVTVPRRKRYLPIAAGMLADLLVVAGLTLIAAALRRPDGTEPLAGGVCLAMAFATGLRFVWQFYFYLQTDLYHMIVSVLGCVDLQRAARRLIVNRIRRILGLRKGLYDESKLHPADLKYGRWYAWLVVAGYAFSGGTILIAGVPIVTRLLEVMWARLFGADGALGFADALVFVLLNLLQGIVVLYVLLRDRWRRRAAEAAAPHVIS